MLANKSAPSRLSRTTLWYSAAAHRFESQYLTHWGGPWPPRHGSHIGADSIPAIIYRTPQGS